MSHLAAWHDPHNNGSYTLTGSTPEQLLLARTSGIGLHPDSEQLSHCVGTGGGGGTGYTDMLVLTLNEGPGTGCTMSGCSESQVTSILDFSTNYCNLHDLFCADSGCHVVNT